MLLHVLPAGRPLSEREDGLALYVIVQVRRLYPALQAAAVFAVADAVRENFCVGTPPEIQIRTELMDRVAEFGSAAHWLYQEDRITELAKGGNVAFRGVVAFCGHVADGDETVECGETAVLKTCLLSGRPRPSVTCAVSFQVLFSSQVLGKTRRDHAAACKISVLLARNVTHRGHGYVMQLLLPAQLRLMHVEREGSGTVPMYITSTVCVKAERKRPRRSR